MRSLDTKIEKRQFEPYLLHLISICAFVFFLFFVTFTLILKVARLKTGALVVRSGNKKIRGRCSGLEKRCSSFNESILKFGT